MNPIRVGVAGVGHLGYHHARNYASLENVTLVGVVDLDPERGRKAAEDFHVPWFKTLDEILAAGVDAVSVSVPTSAHFETATQLLNAGVDVLVEKPLAATTQEAEQMVALAEQRERILQVGHIERFNGAVIALFDAIKHPRFIECHRLSPYPNRGQDVSVVLDLMIHDLEIVLALDRSELVSMDAVGVSVFSEQEDIANVRLRFASGCVANLTCSRISLERMRKIRIFEQDAYLSTDYSDQEVLVYRKKPVRPEVVQNPMELITVDPLPVHREEPLRRELQSFVACVRDRTRPVVSGADGLAALRLAEDIVTFIREHR